MDKFAEKDNFPKLTHEEIEILSSQAAIKLFEFLIKKFPQRKLQAQKASLINSIKYLRRTKDQSYTKCLR